MNSNNSLRIVQIIDSLSPGGAEQMTVSFANSLVDQGHEVCLIATRAGGLLESKLNTNVQLEILNKKSPFDVAALRRLISILRSSKCHIVHAHTSSVVWATFAHVFLRKPKLVWHVHCGNPAAWSFAKTIWLRLLSKGWSAIFTVNHMSDSAENALHFPSNRIFFINNFTSTTPVIAKIPELEKFKNPQSVNIACIANIRPEKDHLNLLNAFSIIAEAHPGANLHLVGRSFNDDHFTTIINAIEHHKFRSRIHFYGTRTDIPSFLSYMNIGVLSSSAEGLPVSLLEYGAAGLSIAATDVGQVKEVLGNGNFGEIAPPHNPEQLAENILNCMHDLNNNAKAAAFHQRVVDVYSESAVVKQIVNIYHDLVESGKC